MATSLVSYTTANSDNAPNATIALPAGSVSGDVLILFVAKDGGAAPSVSGFTQQYAGTSSGSANDSLWWKAVGVEPANYTVTMNGNERAWCCLALFREVDNIDPFQSFNSFVSTTGVSSSQVPQITRDISDQMCVAFLGLESGNSGNPVSPAWSGAGWTTISDNQNGPAGTGSGSAAGAFATQQTAATGLLGPDTYTYGGGNSQNTTLAFALRLGAPPEIGINSTQTEIKINDTSIPIDGFGFEPVQGSGKVEIGDSADYSTATLVEQTVVAWSDTFIEYDETGLSVFPDGLLFLFVTDSDGNRISVTLIFGLPSYDIVIASSNPDHWWPLSGNYDDAVGANPFTAVTVGTNGFAALQICEDAPQSWRVQDGRRECPNSGNMNTTITTNRLMGGWIRLGGIQTGFSCLYEEGGGVNNLAFFLGINNTLIAQQADTSDDNVQAFSDVSLEPNRNYHILFKFSYTEPTKEFVLFLDGEKQQSTSGNPLLSTDLDAHSGDISLGGPGGNLEVGGTDVLFRNQEDTYFSQWVTYSEETSEDLVKDLFRRGALPTYNISGTEAQMQTQLDALAGVIGVNDPLTIRINDAGTPLSLSLSGFTFNALSSIHLEYRGTEPLNWTNLNGTNLTIEKVYSPQSGTVNITNPATITLLGLEPNTEIRLYEAGTINEVGGVENSGTSESFELFGVPAVDIVIHNLDYIYQKLDNIDTSATRSIPVQQFFDRNYENP